MLADLRARGHRVTRQRAAIVGEVLATTGHISAAEVAQRVGAVDPSTVYRTLELLERAGWLSHCHHERGADYHHSEDHDHVHLVCSGCGASLTLNEADTAPLKAHVESLTGFEPDFTHFNVAGLCRRCRARRAGRSRRGARAGMNA